MKKQRHTDGNFAGTPEKLPVFRRERFGFDTMEDDSSWLISMSDLMSLLLVFFLVWTAVNIAHTPDSSSASRSKVTVKAEKSRIEKLHEQMKGRLYEFIPTSLKNSFMVIAFNHAESEKNASDNRGVQQRRAEAWLTPVDMQVISLE